MEILLKLNKILICYTINISLAVYYRGGKRIEIRRRQPIGFRLGVVHSGGSARLAADMHRYILSRHFMIML